MTEREVIPVVCVYAAGKEDGYPHLEGLELIAEFEEL